MNTPTYFDETEAHIGDKMQHGLYGQCIVVGMDKATDELDVVNVLTGEEINCLSINCDLLHRDGGFQWIRVGAHMPDTDRDVLFTDGMGVWTGFYSNNSNEWIMDAGEVPENPITHWMPLPVVPSAE